MAAPQEDPGGSPGGLPGSAARSTREAVIAYTATFFTGMPFQDPVLTLLLEYLPEASEVALNELQVRPAPHPRARPRPLPLGCPPCRLAAVPCPAHPTSLHPSLQILKHLTGMPRLEDKHFVASSVLTAYPPVVRLIGTHPCQRFLAASPHAGRRPPPRLPPRTAGVHALPWCPTAAAAPCAGYFLAGQSAQGAQANAGGLPHSGDVIYVVKKWDGLAPLALYPSAQQTSGFGLGKLFGAQDSGMSDRVRMLRRAFYALSARPALPASPPAWGPGCSSPTAAVARSPRV
jgi:hypothetical protein